MRSKRNLFIGLVAASLILGLPIVLTSNQDPLPDWVEYQVEPASHTYFDLTVISGSGLLAPGQYPAWCAESNVPIPTGTPHWGEPLLLDTEAGVWKTVLFALTHREGYAALHVQEALWYWLEARSPDDPGAWSFITYVESASEGWQPPDGTYLVMIRHTEKQNVLLIFERPPTPTPPPVGALQIDKRWSGPGDLVEEIIVYAYPKEHAPPERTPGPVRTPTPLPDGWVQQFSPFVARAAYMPVVLRWQGQPVCVDGLEPGTWVLDEQVVRGSGHAPIERRLEVEVLPDTSCSEGDAATAVFENVRTPTPTPTATPTPTPTPTATPTPTSSPTPTPTTTPTATPTPTLTSSPTPTPTPKDWILGWQTKAIDPPGSDGENREELAPGVEPSWLSGEELKALTAFIEGGEHGELGIQGMASGDLTIVAILDSRTGGIAEYLLVTADYWTYWREFIREIPQYVIDDAGPGGPSIQNGDFAQGELHWTLPNTPCRGEVVSHEGAPALRLGPDSATVECYSTARQHLSPNYELYLSVYNDGVTHGECAYLYDFFRGIYTAPRHP